MTPNEKAHLRGVGSSNSKSVQPPVSTHAAYSASTSTEAVIGALSIVDVWQALGGGELRRGRGRAFWRDGDGFNVALYPEAGAWRDFKANEGGGLVCLVQTARRCTRGEAFRWLADLAGIALTPDSPARRARYAEARRATEALAKLACWWLAGRLWELEELKRLNNGDEGPFDEDALTSASSKLWRLEQIEAADVVPEWMAARASDPDRTGKVEQVGQVWERFRHAVIGRVVQQLAESQTSGSEVLHDPS